SIQRGYGAALKTGIKNAKFDNIATLDADGTYPPTELLKLLKFYNKDLIIGVRRTYFSLIRHFFNKFLAIFASFIFCKWISDLNSGMRIFKKSILNRLNYFKWTDGFSFSTTMTLSVLTRNFSIKTVPIYCQSRREKSKVKIVRLGLTILKMIFHYFKRKYKPL
ncbi:MAG: glycosyltransferase family 2 protein, partial [Candidatus Helarchaeota archaeon]